MPKKVRPHNIEYLHTKIHNSIELIQSYSGVQELGSIIRMCRLKPYVYIFEKEQIGNRARVYYYWVDEFGNGIEITKTKKKKKLTINYYDLRLHLKKISSTDLYIGNSASQMFKVGQMMHLVCGTYNNDPVYLLSLLGIDGFLRSFLFWNNQWQSISPLFLGLEHLKIIAKNSDLKYFITLNLKKRLPTPCLNEEGWLSYLPVGMELMEKIKKRHPILTSIIRY